MIVIPASTSCTLVAAALAALLLGPRDALAQSSGNPGQFGGGAPGQFDPNALPGAQPGTLPPGQFDPNAQAGAARPGQFDPHAIPNGSSPPPGFGGPTDPNDPNASLDAAKDEDSGRGITWFWAEVGGGFEHVGLQTLHSPERSDACLGNVVGAECASADTSPNADLTTTGTGPMIEGGLGARLLFFTLGARGRLGFFQRYDLATIGGELGFRIPIGAVEPRLSIGGGYAATMNGNAATGGYGRLTGGLDYFVASNFAIGGDLAGQIHGLSASILERGGTRSAEEVDDILTSVGGTGLGVALGLHVGLHL